MEQTKPYSLQSPESIAKEYGGDKRKIAHAVQMGMVDPTAATLAGMFIDRMRSAAIQEQNPNETVTAKVFTPPQVAQAGLAAAPGAQMAQQVPQQMGPAPTQQPITAADGGLMEMNEGLMSINVPEDMYNYGGGGIVAFAAGTPPDMTSIPNVPTGLNSTLTNKNVDPKVLRAYYIAKGLPIPEELKTDAEKGIAPVDEPASSMGELLKKPFGGLTRPMGQINEPSMIEKFFMRKKQEAMGGAPSAENLRGIAAIPGAGVAGGDVEAQPGGFYGGLVPPAAPTAETTAPAAGTTPATTTPAAAVVAPKLPVGETPTLKGEFDKLKALLPEGEAYADLEKQIASDKESRKAEAQNNIWLRVAEMGFGMAASKSPYLAQAIGEAGTQALKGYADDLKEQKKLDREDRKFLADISQARRAERIGNVKTATESYDRAMGRLSDDKRAQLQADTQIMAAKIQASRPTTYGEYRADALSGDPKRQKVAQNFIGVNKLGTMTYEDAVKLAIQGNPTLGMPGREQQLQAAVQNLISGQYGSGLPAGVTRQGIR